MTLRVNGRQAELRELVPEDAAVVVNWMRSVAAETGNNISEPDEVPTAEKEAAWLRRLTREEKSSMWGVFAGGSLIACASLLGISSKRRLRHRAELSVTVSKAYLWQGISEALVQTALDFAQQAGYRQVETDVLAGSSGALSKYQKMGFVQYGLLPDAVRFRGGQTGDWVLLVKQF